MAELTSQERLQPSLLDRLTDDEPDANKESRGRRVLSMQRLRAAVLRDLAALLNTGHLETIENLDDYPEVRNSVLNYGMPDITGLSIASTDTVSLEKAVRDSIVKFEPRIDARSLSVTINRDTSGMSKNSMVFSITGRLWAEPTPVTLYLKTVVDLETGDVVVRDA
jgi:type VI secretion system protein ImpF